VTEHQSDQGEHTVYQLYKEIVKSKLLEINADFSLIDSDIRTLQVIHRAHFSVGEWRQICIFEHQYGHTNPKEDWEHEKLTQDKWHFWKSCQDAQSLAKQIISVSKATLNQNENRKMATSLRKQPIIQASRKHRFVKIENDVENALKIRFRDIGQVVAADVESSIHHNSVHIYVELMSHQDITANAKTVIQRVLERHHKCGFSLIIFFKAGSFDKYKQDDKVAKFTLRDAVLMGQIQKNLIAQYEGTNDDIVYDELEDDSDKGIECATCFDENTAEQLDVETLDIFKEWYCNVPLQLQLILHQFVNTRSLFRSDDKIMFMRQKLQLLYGIYDTLLHVYNKNYFGVFQMANADELIMGYKSVQTVFEVSSNAGASTSFSFAERRLKSRAVKDDLYYSAYLKPYLMTYQTDAGMVTKEVRMRDCFIILMIDNLVRLRFNDDPDRGEHRSKQMNLLPITVQGVPADSIIITSWHNPNICNGTNDCPCKNPVTLTKDNISECLFELSEAEAIVHGRFSKLCTWGSQSTWKQILQDVDFKAWFKDSIFQTALFTNNDDNEDTVSQEVNLLCEDLGIISQLEMTDAQPECEVVMNEMDTQAVGPEGIGFLEQVKKTVVKDPQNLHLESSHNLSTHILQEEESSSNSTDDDISSIDSDSWAFSEDETGDVESELEHTDDEVQGDEKMILDVLAALDAAQLEEVDIEVDEHLTGLSDIIHEKLPVEESHSAFDGQSVTLLETSFEAITLSDPHHNIVNDVEDVIQVKVEDDAALDDDQEVKEDKISTDTTPLPVLYGLNKFVLPPLLCRHPEPYSGRDDDPTKLREVCDDTLTFMGYHDEDFKRRKILCGPDHKIGKNLMNMVKQRGQDKYKMFLPEFPCLHLRKSRITIVFSAFKDAGLMQLLQYMRDDDSNEWAKLTTAQHIDVATRNVRRLSQALHVASVLKFISEMPKQEACSILFTLENEPGPKVAAALNDRYQLYLKNGSQRNGTFALHVDMMKHLDGILAIALAERLGGEDGYNLLLSSSKESLIFSFLNAATSYSPYCVDLLHQHYKAGSFYSNMKQSLFSTPLKNGGVNMASDTKREMDHQAITKGFRSGSTMESVLRRTGLADDLNKTHKLRSEQRHPGVAKADTDMLGCVISETDIKHIIPTSLIILKKNGFSSTEDPQAFNIYSKNKILLSPCILDKNCITVGKYVIKKYIAKAGLFSCNASDAPQVTDMQGPKDLIKKAEKSKGVTIKRMSGGKALKLDRTERQLKEEKRKKMVTSTMKRIDCLSSDMNACQALVKPDCSKPSLTKSLTMADALKDVICSCLGECPKSVAKQNEMLREKKLVICGSSKIHPLPAEMAQTVKSASLEFAGVLFKTVAISGLDYLKSVEMDILEPVLAHMRKLTHLVICEEKYRFTPDTFKAATRHQRSVKHTQKSTIHHLKSGREILSAEKFNKEACITSKEGKTLISTYVAKNVDKIVLNKDLVLDIDSEYYTEDCTCSPDQLDKCQCTTKYAVPIRCKFSHNKGILNVEKLCSIQQRKGEAEMAQVDWLTSFQNEGNLKEGDSAASIVTSGDIDSVVIHLYFVSQRWPRNNNKKFIHPVFVILQKPSGADVYNITAIIETIESKYPEDEFIAPKLAMLLCIGGNDFIPKLHGINHKKMFQLFLTQSHFRESLFRVEDNKLHLVLTVYIEFVKWLYCSKSMGDPAILSFDSVRRETMLCRKTSAVSKAPGEMNKFKHPQKWMPPKSALESMAQLIQLQISYLEMAGEASAILPDFLASDCLCQNASGEVEYNFGIDSFVASSDLSDMTMRVCTPKKKMRKRPAVGTPQKGARKKVPLTSSTLPLTSSTPVKETPKKKR
jgi:hypothetical protein